MNHPRLIVVDETHRSDWQSLTMEQRQGRRDYRGKLIDNEIRDNPHPWMTAAELRTAMGPFHVQHSDFKERPRSLLPMPNLSGVQPMI